MPTGFQAGSAYVTIGADLAQFDRDLAKAKAEIAAFQASARTATAPANRGASGGNDSRAADAALRLASARASLARAEGDEARALQILNGALAQNAGASETASLRVQTMAARLENGTTFAQEFGRNIVGGFTSIIGPAALATAAIGAATATVQSFVDAFKFKAELDQSTAAIKSQLDGFRDANATYEQAIAFGRQYNITQQETNAILSSSTDILRTSTSSVSELETALIRLQSRDVSKPISEASRALRELQSGDVTSIKELFNIPAKDALRMRDQIVAGGDAVKVLTAYLDSAKIGMSALEQRTQGTAGKMRELAQAQEDLKLAQADFAQGPGLLFLQGQIRTTTGITRVLTGDFRAMGDSVVQSSNDASNAIFAWLNAMTGFVPAQQQATAATEQHAVAAYFSADAEDRRSAATQNATTAATDAGTALAEQAQKSLDAAAQAENLAQFQTQLANLGGAVAGGLSTASEAAVVLAQNYGIAYDAALKLINAQAALAQAKNAAAALADQRAGERNPGSSGQAEVAAQEERRLQALYRSLQNVPTQTGGRVSSGRAGGGRLSDQQKLNNQLLTDEQKANDRFESEAREHARNLLKIEHDYQQKSLEQQRKNEIDKRQSELSFLEKLTGSSLNKGDAQSKAALQQINQDYYAAYEKAQQIAQAGNAQLADEYLKLKQEQYEAEIQYQEALAQARENHDTAEVARLQALEAKRQAIYAEREKQLVENGDANQNARADAIQQEDARYEEAQGKIADSAERAADRKIAAAQRAGKAIDAETAALQKQADQYERMGRTPSASPPTPAPATTATTATPSSPSGDTRAVQLLAVADAAVLGAIQSQTAMQAGKFDAVIARLGNVEQAVRGLAGAFAR